MIDRQKYQGFKRVGDILPKYREVEEMPEAEFECPKHGKYCGKPIKIFGFINGGEHIIDPDCPDCLGKQAQEETEEAERRRIARLREMNIDARYWNEDFDTFDDYTPELKRHLKTCRDFAAHPKGKLVMLGNNGTGKNHLAVSILKKTDGVIYTFLEMCLMLRQGYNGSNQEWETLQKFCKTSLLIIDEIGRSKGSDWELSRLSHIFNKRHANYRPMIIISNRHLMANCPEGAKGCPKCLENYIDNDVISRIIEDGTIMKFTGEDYRYKIRIAGKKSNE
jgi:DNA replication protein DnaC